ncbi:hypothetical protein Q75_05040 [Bacillus coahuilensis p1.1.43]|uniref:Sporulation protein Spo0E n=1 Tax=Bacillus coahuilensis p1.1.43 TaxID=1150625 RepID=A0A147KA81_9BACI|nr:hypothetical protein Q75_05040 [Bacillus coahuilensis p1.1.43]
MMNEFNQPSKKEKNSVRIQLNTNETHTLDFLVQIKRKEMIYHGLNHGLSHPRTIRLSQELDILLNQYGI